MPTFYIRQKGPQVKLVFSPAVRIEKYGDQQADIRNNLQRVISIFEAQISKYPEEYFWTYKIWKYSDQSSILILDDGKAISGRRRRLAGWRRIPIRIRG
ncbi:hypothetical protein ACFLZ3_03785 [Candidatus Omnitrophota bacterium]